MRLFDFQRAPNPRRARMIIAEKNIAIETVPVNLYRMEQLSAEFLAINPAGTVPVLETDDGTYLTETIAICTYLEELYPDPPLLGRTATEKSLVLNWNNIAEQTGMLSIAEMLRNWSPGFRNRVFPGELDYPQMPELIERGHVYIAQPPLYKLTSGKKEIYVKDDDELHKLLLDLALEDAQIVPDHNPDSPLTGSVLRGICSDYFAVETAIQRMARRYQPEVLWTLSGMASLDLPEITNPAELETFGETLSEALNVQANTGGATYRVAWDDQEDGATLVVDSERHGRYRQSRFPAEFFGSTEYASLMSLGQRLETEIGKALTVKRGQREQHSDSFAEALSWLMSEARRGINIQRYKGLGEMNPDQLWETTMDAEQRRLSQVQIEDAVGADEIFTVLMGEEVAPRRDFIQRNAFAVNNLDV